MSEGNPHGPLGSLLYSAYDTAHVFANYFLSLSDGNKIYTATNNISDFFFGKVMN